MFDHLTRLKQRNRRRTALGVGVSVAVHLLLLAVLVLGADSLRRAAESGQSGAAGGRDPAAMPGLGAHSREAKAAEEEAEMQGLSAALAEVRAPGVPTPRTDVQIPDTLWLGRSSPVRVTLFPLRTPPDTTVRVAAPDGQGSVDLRLTRIRQAELRAGHAVVEPGTPSLRLADRTSATVWHWTVTPTRAGRHPLLLRLDAVVQVEGRDSVITMGTVERELLVRATAIQRISDFFAHHWTWLAPLGLLAAGLALRGWWRGHPRASGAHAGAS